MATGHFFGFVVVGCRRRSEEEEMRETNKKTLVSVTFSRSSPPSSFSRRLKKSFNFHHKKTSTKECLMSTQTCSN